MFYVLCDELKNEKRMRTEKEKKARGKRMKDEGRARSGRKAGGRELKGKERGVKKDMLYIIYLGEKKGRYLLWRKNRAKRDAKQKGE